MMTRTPTARATRTATPMGTPPAATAPAGWRSVGLAVLFRPAHAKPAGADRLITWTALIFGAAMVAGSAAIHLHLWQTGYRHLSEIGPAFMFQSVSGFALAVALLAYPRLATVAAGAAFCLGSVVALALSATVGLLGFTESIDAPWAHWSLAIESAGFVVLAALALTTLVRRR